MAVGIDRNTRIQSFVLEKAIPFISNEIKRNDGVVAVMGANKRIKVVNGGDLFEERVEYAENSNIGWGATTSQVATNQQDNWLTAKFGQAHLKGAIVINEIEEDQNSGQFAISNMLEAMIQNAVNTVVRLVADALRSAAPGALEPNSIVNMIQATAFGGQAGVTGNLNRATYPTWWQNQYNATAADLSAKAGVKTLEDFYWQNVAKGSALSEQPDFGLLRGSYYASLSAYGDDSRRLSGDENMRKLGFDSIKLLNMAIIADPAMPATTMFLLNTNYLRLQVLRAPSMKDVGKTPETLPLTMKRMQDDIDSFNKVQLLRVTMNLTTNSLQRQGRQVVA